MIDERQTILLRLSAAVDKLLSCSEFAALIPEVRTNIVFALPDAQTPNDVAAVDGRITVVAGRPKAAGPVWFGASDHLARLVLELRRFNPAIRSAVNFRWNEKIMDFVSTWVVARKKFLGVIDRSKEPLELIGQDRMSVHWKVQELICSTGGKVPEIIYETRGWGKEPLFILVGEDPVPLVESLIEIAQGYAQMSL